MACTISLLVHRRSGDEGQVPTKDDHLGMINERRGEHMQADGPVVKVGRSGLAEQRSLSRP